MWGARQKNMYKKQREGKELEKRKKVQILMLLLLLSGFPMLPVVSTPEISNPYELIIATVGEPDTVDPAWAYDTASLELIFNVYETLIFYDGENVDEFVPCLATEWSYDEETYACTFRIRTGVYFHNGEILTAEDVEYSFERLMVQDRFGGPTWMIYEQLLGCYGADMDDPDWINRIDATVESDNNNVYFHLAESSNPTIFLQIIAQPFCSILSKDWAVAQGCWDGVYTMESLLAYHDPGFSPLIDPEPVMMGTGPYKFDYWEIGVEWSIIKFDDYWQGWPAYNSEIGECRGYVTRVTERFIMDWAARKMMFLGGDADLVYVPRMGIDEVFCQPGTRCVYPLPTLTVTAMFFNFYMSTTSPYLGPGFDPADPYVIAEDRVPFNFFSDVDVREAFAYSFDYDAYILYALMGEAIRPATCVVKGLPYYNPEQEGYILDLAQAEEHFRSAWGGQLWEKGFTISMVYNTGSEARQLACEMIAYSVESLNPKFHVYVIEADWGYYLQNLVNFELPIFILGWFADYPDPHSFVHASMHSDGSFSYYQGYGNSYVDSLIAVGLESAESAERETVYYELQAIYHDECISIPLYQPFGRHFERDWVQGWYYNQIYPGVYAYHLWKEALPPEDVNMDGRVNNLDVARVGSAYGSWYEPGYVHPRWNSRADINCDQVVDDYDVTLVEKMLGWQAPSWTPPEGPTPPPPDEVVIEDVIVPEELDTDVIAFRLSKPLQPGDAITPSVSEPGHEYVPEPGKTVWFYWINDCPYAGYAHETRYVFVEEETGDCEVFVEEWPPMLNGDVLWEDPEEYWNPQNWAYSTANYTQASTVYEISSSASWIESKIISAGNLESQSAKRALIIEGYDHPRSTPSKPSSFQNASELWYDLFKDFGYSDKEIVYLTPESRQNEYEIDYTCTTQNVATAIQSLTSLDDDDNLIVFIAAHGGVKYWNNLTGYIQLVDGDTLLYDYELTQHLGKITNDTDITVIMQSCYCGSFMDDLWTLDNVDTIVTSTDWKSVSYMASAGMDPPLVYSGISGMTQDPNLQDEGGEFSSGMRKGLDDSWQSYIDGSITLGELYVEAYKKGVELDAGYINRETLANNYGNNYTPNPLMKTVFFPGDIDLDYLVNIVDISIVAIAYGTRPGDSEWNPITDMDRNRWINIVDISMVAVNYFKTY